MKFRNWTVGNTQIRNKSSVIFYFQIFHLSNIAQIQNKKILKNLNYRLKIQLKKTLLENVTKFSNFYPCMENWADKHHMDREYSAWDLGVNASVNPLDNFFFWHFAVSLLMRRRVSFPPKWARPWRWHDVSVVWGPHEIFVTFQEWCSTRS